jgi:hypothetical protein
MIAGGGFNPFSAGRKMYGSGRDFPTSGKVDKLGYAERDAQTRARRGAILRRMQSGLQGKYASADYNRYLGG